MCANELMMNSDDLNFNFNIKSYSNGTFLHRMNLYIYKYRLSEILVQILVQIVYPENNMELIAK